MGWIGSKVWGLQTPPLGENPFLPLTASGGSKSSLPCVLNHSNFCLYVWNFLLFVLSPLLYLFFFFLDYHHCQLELLLGRWEPVKYVCFRLISLNGQVIYTPIPVGLWLRSDSWDINSPKHGQSRLEIS